ncbi:hypothetical protein Tco_0625832 [Tanacetum coccineum]|uniref:Synaptobrevin, longin-like domain protein n=1 Tax=Tanacetum coccineum TaxID=301880 RepID=A0ABQ4WHW9_9ASTR
MAALQYKDDHNRIAYLGREKGSEDFGDILSYVDHSPLRYALTHDPPVVFDSLVKQFWATAVVRPNAAGSHDLVATIDGREVVVTESLIRTQLHFEDANGIVAMPNSDILEGMRVIGYPTDRALTFLKHHLSPQWRFLVHTLMHCLSPKAGSWNQFPSSIATTLICLSTGRVYNFSRFILEGMIANVKTKKNKFLMYPRFLQMLVAIETADRTPRPTSGFTRKLFSNMKLKWEGEEIPLTPPMLAIAAAGNDAADDDDAANEDNAAADEAAGSAAEAHPVPHSPPVSPVRELTPERQSASERPPSLSPTPPAQTFSLAEPLVFGPEPRPAGYVDPDVLEPIIFGPQPRPSDFVDPDLEEPVIFGPPPRPDNYIEPADIDNLVSMEDDTIHGGFHEESPVGPDDAPTPTADAAGRAEDPTLLTSLSAKLDRCMGRIDSLETELGTSKKIMGGAILTLVSRVKKLERTVKQLKTARFVGDAPATEGDVNIQDDVDLEGLSRMASEALGHDQPAVPSEHMEEREEEEVPLRRKRSVYRRARTEFNTSAFAQFNAPLSADVLPQAAISESAGPSAAADKGKAPMPELDIPAEFLAEDAQARQRLEEEQASERLVQRLLEEREEEEVPLRRKRSVYRRARTEFNTSAFAQFHAPLSTDVLPQAEISESAGPSVGADKGKAPMPDLEIPAEFLAEDAQARKRLEEEQASARLVQQLQAEDLAQADVPIVSEQRAKELDELMLRMTETDWLTLMMQVGTNPALARELLGADVNEDNFIERMTAIKERKKRALADLRYRALKGKPLKQSEVTQMMRNLVKNQWCAAHNGTITMKAVTAMSKQQLIAEYENICRRLEKDRLLSAQYNLFRPKPAITEPPSKRQRVERASSQPSDVPAATTQPADDPDSAGGSSFHPAGSAPPLSGSAAPTSAGVPDSTVPTSAAMDTAGSHRESGVSPFVDSDASSSPSPVSTDHIPIDVLFDSTSGGLNAFFLASDEDAPICMSRVAADPDSNDEVLAEILFRGQYISGAGVVVVDKLSDDEIIDRRVKVETIPDSAASPPRSCRKHRGVRSDDSLWDKPVEDFFSSESESDDDMQTYIPPIPYGAFKDWEIVRCPLSNTYYHVYYQENRRQQSFFYLKELLPHVYREDLLLLRRRMNRYFRLNPDVDVGLDLWRDVNLLCQSLHSDDVEDFWRTQDAWIVSGWKLYPKSSVHVLDLTNGTTVYMFVDKVYPIQATLLERMLRHRLIVPPSYCRDVVIARKVIQTVQAGLRESYECLASVPIFIDRIVLYNFGVSACTARQMVFSSPWLTAKKESGSPLQTALVCNSNPLLVTRVDMVINPPWNLPFLGAKGLTSPEQTATAVTTSCCKDWKLLFFNVAACFVAAGYLVSAVVPADSSSSIPADNVPADSSSSIPADYVSAGHVLVSADRDRIC